jgi:hypothetical protein
MTKRGPPASAFIVCHEYRNRIRSNCRPTGIEEVAIADAGWPTHRFVRSAWHQDERSRHRFPLFGPRLKNPCVAIFRPIIGIDLRSHQRSSPRSGPPAAPVSRIKIEFLNPRHHCATDGGMRRGLTERNRSHCTDPATHLGVVLLIHVKEMGHRRMHSRSRPVIGSHIHDTVEHFQKAGIPVFGKMMPCGKPGIDESLQIVADRFATLPIGYAKVADGILREAIEAPFRRFCRRSPSTCRGATGAVPSS